jgi:hypothetical protein
MLGMSRGLGSMQREIMAELDARPPIYSGEWRGEQWDVFDLTPVRDEIARRRGALHAMQKYYGKRPYYIDGGLEASFSRALRRLVNRGLLIRVPHRRGEVRVGRRSPPVAD